MKKYILFLLVLCCVAYGNAYAQVSNYIDVVYLKNGSIIKGLIIEDAPNVEVKIQTSSGNIFVYSYTDILKFAKEKKAPSRESTPQVVVKEKVKKEKKIYESEQFALVGVALHPSQKSTYVMVGKVKNTGAFLKLKTNFHFSGKHDGVEDSYFLQYDRYLNGSDKKGRFAITGGMLWRLSEPLMLYGGFGYGTRWVNWEASNGDMIRVADISYRGLELESGLTYKYDRFYINGGVSLTSFKHMEANIGFGITIKGDKISERKCP